MGPASRVRDLRLYLADVRNRAAACLGLPALALALVVGCGADDDARPDADSALPSYSAPDDAPSFCDELAATREVDALPASIGLLVAGPDVEARTQVSRAVRELRDVLAEVRDDGGHDDLSTALDGLIGSLGQVIDGDVTDPVQAAVTDALEQVGVTAQPACRFPA
jgi:hypothetical protein